MAREEIPSASTKMDAKSNESELHFAQLHDALRHLVELFFDREVQYRHLHGSTGTALAEKTYPTPETDSLADGVIAEIMKTIDAHRRSLFEEPEEILRVILVNEFATVLQKYLDDPTSDWERLPDEADQIFKSRGVVLDDDVLVEFAIDRDYVRDTTDKPAGAKDTARYLIGRWGPPGAKRSKLATLESRHGVHGSPPVPPIAYGLPRAKQEVLASYAVSLLTGVQITKADIEVMIENAAVRKR